MSAAVAPGPTTTPPGTDRPARRRRRGWVPYALLAPGLLWLGVFFLVPTVQLLAMSLYDPSGSLETGYRLTFAVGNYADVVAAYLPQIGRSLLYAGLATVLALVLGYPLAYTIAQKSGRWRNVLLVLVVAPFFTSFLLRTLAWRTILADQGPVVEVLRAVHLLGADGRLLATPVAVVCGLTYNFLPFMVLPLYASLERLDPRLLEAAADLYGRPLSAFARVTLPLSMPGVVGGTLLTAIPAAGDYINSELLGTTRTTMVGNVVDSLFLVRLDYPAAAALSLVLMATIVVLVALYVRRAGTEELL